MSDTGILGVFQSHAFLANLSHQHLMTLASGVKPFAVEKGKFLATEGTTANNFFLIQAGHVSVEINHPKRGAVSIQTIGPGEIVGWSWIVPNYTWHFDCRAVDDVKGLVFNASWLRDQCEQDPQLGYHLLKQLVTVIASRLSATLVQLLDIYK